MKSLDFIKEGQIYSTGGGPGEGQRWYKPRSVPNQNELEEAFDVEPIRPNRPDTQKHKVHKSTAIQLARELHALAQEYGNLTMARPKDPRIQTLQQQMMDLDNEIKNLGFEYEPTSKFFIRPLTVDLQQPQHLSKESAIMKGLQTEQTIEENLRKWFKEKWVRFGPDGKIRGACARGDDSEGKPKCLPQAKAHALGKKGRKYAAAKKRREDPNPERRGPAKNVATKKKTKEGVAEGFPQPGETSGKAKQFNPNAKIQTKEMTLDQILNTVKGIPYVNEVIQDWDAKDYSWGVTKKVIEYAQYLQKNPQSVANLPPLVVIDGQLNDGAHRLSAINLLQKRMDPKNPLWKQVKLKVNFGTSADVMSEQGVAEAELDEACWKGYHKEGMKTMFGKKYPNCVKNKKTNEEEQLDEKCWDTHKQVGMKSKGGKMVPNCVPKESVDEDQAPMFTPESKCPHCGGKLFEFSMMNEKKDACYYKVKSRYKVWPSAYASGALVKCRKKGASNWGTGGKKDESIEENLGTPYPGTYEQETAPIKSKGQKRTPMIAFETTQLQLDEKWSEKYKKSINCSNPKGFSQKAHCAGRKKK